MALDKEGRSTREGASSLVIIIIIIISQVTCEALLEEVTSPVFSSLANWLETSGDAVCSFNGSGFMRISSTLAIIIALVNIPS